MVRKQFFMPQPLVDRLRTEAERTGLTEAELVRRAIEEYLARREREARRG